MGASHVSNIRVITFITEICCGVEIETKVGTYLHGFRYNCLDV